MRLLVFVALVAAVAVAGAGTGAAAPPAKGCPPAASGFLLVPVDLTWMPGDGVPAPGTDPFWDMTVAGTLAEGLTLEQAAELFVRPGATVEDLYAFALAGWRSVDRNGDAAICVQRFPEQGGQPAFIFNVVDTNAAAIG